jgi:hypothetical protein
MTIDRKSSNLGARRWLVAERIVEIAAADKAM